MTFDYWLKSQSASAYIYGNAIYGEKDMRSAWNAGDDAERAALFSRVRAAVDKLSAGDAATLYELLDCCEEPR